MAEVSRRLRKRVTRGAVAGAIAVSRALPIGPQRFFFRRLVRLGGSVPALRSRVAKNMRSALGATTPPRAAGDYFRHVGWLYASSLAVFHRKLSETPVVREVRLGDTVSVLDEAYAEGRGVMLTVPHWTGHELVAACIARRHPIVFLVRETPDVKRAAEKAKWYSSLEVETVIRPHKSSSLKEAAAYLKVLKSGRMLAITPDLLADGEHGVGVRLFGRQARILAGAFTLAVSAGAPMVRVSGVWQPDSTVILTFERAPTPSAEDRGAAIQEAAQSWCDWFERCVRLNPENWLFWLDKRWTKFLQTQEAQE